MPDARPPFIRNVIHPSKIIMNTQFSIILEGDWPTPSWEHEITNIDINEKDFIISIQYLGSRRAGVGLQAIKSFTIDFNITLKQSGDWKLIIKGKNENWESQILVHEYD